MFENYSLADLSANLYKKRWVNLAVLVVLAMMIAGPLMWRTIKNSASTNQTTKTYYSTTSLYTLTLPQAERLSSDASPRAGAYADYYYYLLQNNLNGAFLTSGLDEKTVKQLAQELGMSEQVLRNSKPENWEKIVSINNLGGNGGVTFSFYTTSQTFNELGTQKFDQLLQEHAAAFPNVTLNKANTITSEPSAVTQAATSGGVSIKKLAVQGIAGVVAASMLVIAVNVGLYIFKPTLNRVGDLARYGLSFIYTVDQVDNAEEVLQVHTTSSVVLVVSSEKMKQRVATKFANYDVVIASDLKAIRQAEQLVFVGEFGVTRYAELEFALNQLQAVQKQAVGALMFPL